MKNYPDPDQHFEKHIKQSAEKYVDGLQNAGLQPNAKLTRAMAMRARAEAEQSYLQESQEVRDHNISQAMSNYRHRNHQINSEGARLALWTCPAVIALFSFTAWYSFSQPRAESILMGVMYSIGALAFLAMLIATQILARRR